MGGRAPRPGLGQAGEARLPAPSRLAVIYAAIATVVGGSALAVVRDPPLVNEPWPFSAYRLYAQKMPEHYIRRHRLFGVTREEPEREIPLVDEYLEPFEHLRFTDALRRLQHEKHPERLEKGMRDMLARYEARRRAGKHDGPALRGVRLYLLRWRLVDRVPRNRDVPDERQLVFEIPE